MFSINLSGQKNNDSLFADFDLHTQKTIQPVIPGVLIAGKKYIRNRKSGSPGKQRIELIKVYSDSSALSRKATVMKTDDGLLLAFDMVKTYGYEKVLFFGDKDYYHDTMLVIRDTIFFKEMADDMVDLSVVYPSENDTLIIRHAYRNTRTDFLYKIYYRPAMKNHARWFSSDMPDYIETYSLVKKDSVFELVKVDTNHDYISNYVYSEKKEAFLKAGLSPFWIALTELAFLENLNDKKNKH
jgi:hypothetical protein